MMIMRAVNAIALPVQISRTLAASDQGVRILEWQSA